MYKDYFPKNLSYLLDNGFITVKSILQITGNTSPGLITMWKNGERQITTKDLVLIANHLNYTVDDLINKDLSINENTRTSDELEILFNKNKDILNEDDKETIKFIVEKRKRKINNENKEEL